MEKAPIVMQWEAAAEARGERKGIAGTLRRVLQKRFGPVPGDIEQRLNATDDIDVLARWTEVVASASSLEEVRAKLS